MRGSGVNIIYLFIYVASYAVRHIVKSNINHQTIFPLDYTSILVKLQ